MFDGKYKLERYVDPWADDLFKWAKLYNIELMGSIWSEEGLETASAFCKRYKIAHQMRDQYVIDKALNDWRETFMSFTQADGRGLLSNVKPIFCTDRYPTPIKEVRMPKRFHELGWHGYSDHTIGNDNCLKAIAFGAKYIEVHMTLNKDRLEMRDHVFSSMPDELAELVRVGRGLARVA